MCHLLCPRLQLEEALKGLRTVTNNVCSIKKDYNTVIPIRRAVFCHLNTTIIVHFFKDVCNGQQLAWQ